MNEFIKAITSIDNEIQKEIIEKIKSNKKLEEYEIMYLCEMKKFIERRKRENGKKKYKNI